MNWFKTDDIRIQDIEPLISPAILIKDYPATTEIAKMVATTRKNAENIISGHDDRLLVVVAGNDVLRILAGRSHHFGNLRGCRIILD